MSASTSRLLLEPTHHHRAQTERASKPRGIRVCADMRALNARLIKDAVPIPSIQEILDGLQGCHLFSEFDLSDAYLQLPVAEDSVDKLTFTIAAAEQLSFTGAIYGLSDLASVLNRVVAAVFRGMTFVRPFFDNVIIASGPSWDGKNTLNTASLPWLLSTPPITE